MTVFFMWQFANTEADDITVKNSVNLNNYLRGHMLFVFLMQIIRVYNRTRINLTTQDYSRKKWRAVPVRRAACIVNVSFSERSISRS